MAALGQKRKSSVDLGMSACSHKRKLVRPEDAERWSITTLREKVVKIGAKIIAHARYTIFPMAEVAVYRETCFGKYCG